MKGRRLARLGHRPPRAAVDGRGPRQGRGQLDVGRASRTSGPAGSRCDTDEERRARRRRATRERSDDDGGSSDGAAGRTPKPADVLVVFGITGDLAQVMTFRSLYRLEQRGLLDCPIVGVAVDDWTLDQLVERARDSIVGTGEPLDEAVFDRFAARLSYVAGRLRRRGDLRARRRRDRRRRDARSSTSRSRRSSSAPSSRACGRRADARRPRRRREAVRPRPATPRARSPPSCTSTSTSRSSTGSTTTSGRWGSRRSSTCASRTRCSSRSGTGTTSSACRSRWPRTSASTTAATSTTRSARCATSSSTT